MRDEGLIGHIGIGAGPVDMIMRYVELGVIEVVLTHNRYNLLDRRAEPLLAQCAAREVAVLNAGVYGGGLLSKGPSEHRRFRYLEAPEGVLAGARAMEAACARRGSATGGRRVAVLAAGATGDVDRRGDVASRADSGDGRAGGDPDPGGAVAGARRDRGRRGGAAGRQRGATIPGPALTAQALRSLPLHSGRVASPMGRPRGQE